MPCSAERLVEADLLGGHRLDLDHLVDAVVHWAISTTIRFGLGGVARPVHVGAGAGQRRLELLEVARRGWRSAWSLIAAPAVPQLLPVRRARRRRQRAWRGSSGWRGRGCGAAGRRRSGLGRRRGRPACPRKRGRLPAGVAVAAGRGACLGARPGSRPGAWCPDAGRCRAEQPRRCASGRSCRRRTAPPRRSRRTWPDLVRPHRDRRLGVLDRERAAEAAALVRVGQLDQVDARAPRAAAERPVADAEHAAASGRSGGR